MSLDPVETTKQEIENAIYYLTKILDPEEVVSYVERIAERMRDELAEQ